jgi:hypothetical protein
MRRPSLRATALACLILCAPAHARDALLDGFKTPPDAAKPRTWWHWTNGNVSEAGIVKDLEWMKRAGIGGFQLVDVAAGGGQTVERKTNFGTPEWLQAVRYAAENAKRLHLEMSLFSSPGWSEAGGPWVKPEQAMKRLVWSETGIAGGQAFAGKLAPPPSNEGPVRDWIVGGRQPDPNVTMGQAPAKGFYADAAVLAYRIPAAASSALPQVAASAGTVDAAALLDDSLNTAVKLAPDKDGIAWVQLRYDQPFTARALSLGHRRGIPVGQVQASNDGTNWTTIVTTPGPQGYHGAQVRTYAFAPVTARYFRLRLEGAPVRPGQVIHWGPVVPATAFELTEFKLFSDARVNRWEDKGAFGSLMNVYEPVPTPEAAQDAVVGDVVDLTSKMDADGTLRWTPPAGQWKVIRFGYANTGARNRPSVPAGSGLEVDKLSARYVAQYVSGYLDPIQKALGPLMGDHPAYVTMDSWEAGMQNWTDDMAAEFRQRRGYDPTPYLPVLAGRVVKSADVSDRFLWDFRRTLADMVADNFYGAMQTEFAKRGLKTYAEASGVALEIPEDTLRNKSKVDIPMAEFWVKALHPESEYYVDVRGAASAGHVFGKPIVAAEAFTGGGYESPYTLKKVADYWFAQGINRLVFHTSAHQPLDAKPGNTMVGTHLNRNITWAEQARPFMDYVARNEYMLQQGRFVADLAYLLPEGAPATMPFWGPGLNPALPKGYDYDFVNTDLLLQQMTVGDDGRLHLPSGMRYRVLVLPPTSEMSVAAIRKIAELVRGGAWIVGQRPRHSTGLAGFPQSEADVNTIAETLWGGLDGVTNTQRQVGKGMVNWGLPLDEVVRKAGLVPDVDASAALDGGVVWLHRTTGGADMYYVVNQKDAAQAVEARFRVTGKVPELWNPMTGETKAATWSATSTATTVSLPLAERESVYVVFRTPTRALSGDAPVPGARTIATLDGPWSLRFEPGPGAPEAGVTLPRLASWTDSSDPMVKFFSGTGVYTKTVNVTAAQRKAGPVVLDLGAVKDVAEVRVNGQVQGIVWAPPYAVDITRGLKTGANTVEIRVTNEWTNRIVGDRGLPDGQKVLNVPASAAGMFGQAATPPASGLLGPVTLNLVR